MVFYDKRDSRGRFETLQGKDLIDFITKNDLLEASVLIWNNDIEFGTEPHIIEVDKAGNIVLIQQRDQSERSEFY